MSKFIDKLNRLSQTVSQPMGFRLAQSIPPKPRLLLIASLPQANVDSLADYVAGADAGLLPVSDLGSGARTIQKISQAAPDIPWGGWLRDIERGEISQIVKAGCDFVVFSEAKTSLALLQNEEVGRILEVEPSLSDGLLKVIDELPVDAVLIASEHEGEYFLTWHHLMLFQRFTDLLTKPLLVSVPSNVTANELQAIGEAGVDGMLVEIKIGQPTGRLNELRQTIDKLTFPSQRKRRKARALLPHISGETAIVAEEEEE